MSFLDSFSKVHCVGIGGIGVSAVARLLVHHGKVVSGSDGALSETVQELLAEGIAVRVGHAEENLAEDADLVVFSSAVPANNPERAAASAHGVRQLNYFEFLGEYSKGMRTVAVSGTNGKSTTTAMLGLILERAGFDPTVIVGSKVPGFPQKNLRLGKSDLFVVEACEHEAHMLHLSPQTIVLTNIEADHLDYYRDLAHIRDTFQEYVRRLPPDGLLIVNADDHVSFSDIVPTSPLITYGATNPADYMATHIATASGMQSFQIVRRGAGGSMAPIDDFAIGVPGRFNAMNALAAATAALELGASPDAVKGALREFAGIWRRFERMGERHGAIVVSDYGHHPTAIRGTLEAAHEFYPDRRVVLAFQPHHHNRTKNLFDEFVASFDGADVLVLTEVFDVAGREEDADSQVSSKDLVKATLTRDLARGVTREVFYGGSVADTQKMLEGLMKEGDVVLVVGAGDIYTIAKRLVA